MKQNLQKLYYSIREVSKLVDEEQHILRYWEKEFELLKPKKNRGGNRTYTDKDILLIKRIKKLLRNQKLSLKGAKEIISKDEKGETDENLFTRADIQDEFERKTKAKNSIKTSKKGTITLDKEETEELQYILKEILSLI
jgi:DNA-binding transcriptional MerR regulator